MIICPVIYQNQHYFTDFWPQLCMLFIFRNQRNAQLLKSCFMQSLTLQRVKMLFEKGSGSTSRGNKALTRDMWLPSFFLRSRSCKLFGAAKQCGESVISDALQNKKSFYVMLGNEYSIFRNINNLYIFSEKPALHTCKIEFFMEGENLPRG